MKRLILYIIVAMLTIVFTIPALSQNDNQLIINGPNDVSMHIEGVELRTEVGEDTPEEADGVFLILYFGIVNESDRQRCVFARDIRLIIDGEKYAPQNWLMDAVYETLEPSRDFTGAFLGHCVDDNDQTPSFAAFDLPELGSDFDIEFYGTIETLVLEDVLIDQDFEESIEEVKTPEEVETPEKIETTQIVEGIVISSQNVNARSCAATTCSVVGVLAPQEKVNVVGQEDEWYIVALADGIEGYVFGDLLEVSDEVITLPDEESSESETETSQTSSDAETNLSIRDMSDEDQASFVKTALMFAMNDNDFDLTIELVTIADGRENGGERNLLIGYTSTASDGNEILQELGAVFGGAGGVIREFDMDIDSVSLVIGDVLGNAVGIVVVSASDLLSFSNGEISAVEFVEKLTITSLTD